jgi:peptidyl-prolyl cis-trans isomerase B (cyclophilin B)
MTTIAINTTAGRMIAQLNDFAAPKTVENFLAYMKAGHYTNTIFHRVIDGFMIQGGGFEPGMKQKPADATVENEARNGLINETYTLAMARTSAPHSASAQFFINVKNNNFLDYPGQDGWGYTVFGKVIVGTEVVDAIKKVKTSRTGMFADVPVEDIVITSIEVIDLADELVEVGSPVEVTAGEADQPGSAKEDDLPEMIDDFNDDLLGTFTTVSFLGATDLSKYGEAVVAAQIQASEAARRLYLLLNDAVAAGLAKDKPAPVAAVESTTAE